MSNSRGTLAAAAAALTLALAARPARACSMIPFSTARYPEVAHIIGAAEGDTVQAGRGDVRAASDHRGTPAAGAVWGQVVRVERLGGLAAGRLPGGTDRVVLVPWSYGADCRTMDWVGSARWAPVGTRGLYTASLRDRAHWVGGVPTLDVFTPGDDPFPDGYEPWMGGNGDLLTVDELFELMEILPVAGTLEKPTSWVASASWSGHGHTRSSPGAGRQAKSSG